MSDKHISAQFDSELNSVSSRVMELGGHVESQIRQAIHAVSQLIEIGRNRIPLGATVLQTIHALPKGITPRKVTHVPTYVLAGRPHPSELAIKAVVFF